MSKRADYRRGLSNLVVGALVIIIIVAFALSFMFLFAQMGQWSESTESRAQERGLERIQILEATPSQITIQSLWDKTTHVIMVQLLKNGVVVFEKGVDLFLPPNGGTITINIPNIDYDDVAIFTELGNVFTYGGGQRFKSRPVRHQTFLYQKIQVYYLVVIG